MKILVDADSCPRLAREAVLRGALRTSVPAIFVANRPIPGIHGDGAVMEICPPGEGAADDRIVENAHSGDLVVTRDVPLALRLVEQSVRVVDDRGRVYTTENVRELKSARDFMFGLAEQGLRGNRGRTYGKRELKAFADSFDRLLTALIRENTPAP
ncbi:MAG: DUF188 domain-containing protein [Spirochaetaceae bacterium]|jgi:uncharacterized protein YaiI (UPF0178 family)|nr:DUF188 domain-containing protein [Spirochaetaceae bacterium]